MALHITGTMFYYYFVCRRKLWCFSQHITLENESERVLLGKILDDMAYGREHKHIMIDETVNVDFIKDWKILHEIKKSKSIEEASIWQVKYYLYFLNQRGIKIEKGILDYPKIKEREEIRLEPGDEEKIKRILQDIEEIVSQEKMPPPVNAKICKSCAYYEYCYV
ncbi:CRISPR-associated exonuclease, Cas4 family [Syntrophobotulus glycolicus DSM 8271]|uniref:CRISPR-associated exonuclease Cas4 n=1 Tax=Syntrophobotulus glycolicus (strain DSM 8271 / FlGlyR) TaxID=645991 RepID=F0SWC7_SYNGF|nr:CRISPR-associated protein Cas4 [Syntrophobotulus glycolicus]ADY55693.1 CRISPR-associated exonuclease, Cas4 family [Syntrophobotulus glycolicus DSM 8271]